MDLWTARALIPGKMGSFIRANSWVIAWLEWASWPGPIIVITQAKFSKEKDTETDNITVRSTNPHIRVPGQTVLSKAKVSWPFQMDLSMKESSRMDWEVVTARWSTPQEMNIKDLGFRIKNKERVRWIGSTPARDIRDHGKMMFLKA